MKTAFPGQPSGLRENPTPEQETLVLSYRLTFSRVRVCSAYLNERSLASRRSRCLASPTEFEASAFQTTVVPGSSCQGCGSGRGKNHLLAFPQKSEMSNKSASADFYFRDEGSIVLLTPLSPTAHEFVEEWIGSDNGYQPYWPTVVIERRYEGPILEGVLAEGMVIA